MKIPEGGEANREAPSRFELTEENVASALDIAKRSTPELRWGEAPYEPGDVEKCLTKGSGGVFCSWTGTAPDEVYAAITGNGPTSAVNALFFAHARDIVIALAEERALHRRALLLVARTVGRDSEIGRVVRQALGWWHELDEQVAELRGTSDSGGDGT